MTATALSPAFRAGRIKILISTYVAYAGFYFGRKAFYVLKGDLQIHLGLDAVALGDLGLLYLIAYTAGQFAAAALGPKTGPRRLLLIGLAGAVIANLAFGLSNSFASLGVFMVVNGLAQATGWTCAMGVLANWTQRAERGTLLGFWSTCYQLGGAAASAYAAWFLAHTGWRGAFFAGSLAVLAAWGCVLALLSNRPEDVGLQTPEESPATPEESGATAPTRQLVLSVLLVGAFYFFVKFVRYALWSWAPYFLQQRFGLSGEQAGYLSTVFDVAGFLGVIVAGVASDRLFAGRRAMPAFILLVGMLFGTLFMYLAGPLGVGLFATGLAWVGFMLYGPDSLLTGAGAIDVGSRRTAMAAAGVINGMGSLGSVLQESVVPRVYLRAAGEVGPVLAMLFGASLLAVICIGVVLLRNRIGRSDL